MKNNIKSIGKSIGMKVLLIMMSMGVVVSFNSCEEDIPGTGDLEDLTPPSADFSASVDVTDFLTMNFSNQSISSTDYSWDLGNGEISTEKNPSATYPDVGTYMVTLTASDKLNATSTITKEIEIIEPPLYEPFILEPGFEDNSLPDGSGDGRDSWRNSDLGGVIQITSSPVKSGDQAAKLPSDGSRVGYQLITVVPDSEYIVSFYYTMKETPVGSLTVSILGGAVDDPADIAAATIESITVNDQVDDGEYIKETISFNSGAFDEIAIYFNNVDVECRLDDFTIENSL